MSSRRMELMLPSSSKIDPSRSPWMQLGSMHVAQAPAMSPPHAALASPKRRIVRVSTSARPIAVDCGFVFVEAIVHEDSRRIGERQPIAVDRERRRRRVLRRELDFGDRELIVVRGPLLVKARAHATPARLRERFSLNAQADIRAAL